MKKIFRTFRSGFKLLLLFVLIAAGVCGWILYNVPDFNHLSSQVQVPIRLASGEKSVREVGPRAPGWVNLKQISTPLVLAIIASEDTTFFSHQGIDFFELTEAIKTDIKRRKFARGASTITQQVIKNVYLTADKNLWRKLKEAFWAWELEKVLSKTEILAFYLNMVEWGPGIYGVQEASHHYFSTSPSLLSPKQAAFLTLLLPSPRRYYSYFKNRELTEWAQKRTRQILSTMKKLDFINEPEFQSALEENLW